MPTCQFFRSFGDRLGKEAWVVAEGFAFRISESRLLTVAIIHFPLASRAIRDLSTQPPEGPFSAT